MKKFVLFIVLQMFWLHDIAAQNGEADFLRSMGKIYSVVAVIAVIFIGIFIFLFRLDRKLTKLENHIKNE
jgi:CcmD family protein